MVYVDAMQPPPRAQSLRLRPVLYTLFDHPCRLVSMPAALSGLNSARVRCSVEPYGAVAWLAISDKNMMRGVEMLNRRPNAGRRLVPNGKAWISL